MLFSWGLPPTPGNVSAVPALVTSPVPAITQMTPKPLIPTEHTHIGTVFHMNYIPECFTREDKEPCAPEMQRGPAGPAKQMDTQFRSDGWRPTLHRLGECDEHLELNPDRNQDAKGLYSLLDNHLSRTSSLWYLISPTFQEKGSPLPHCCSSLRKRSEPAFP